jgi:hypothetical protein
LAVRLTSVPDERGSAAVGERGGVYLYWIPLGAGGPGGGLVRWCGRVFEGWSARRAHRPAQPLYHAALEVVGDGSEGSAVIIEMAPAWSVTAPERGVVVEGPVGLRPLGRLRTFRYEIRRWRGGQIPDRAYAVESPRRLSDDADVAARVLALVAEAPPLTWGRDELGAGDMWNSNSLVAWLLVASGLEVDGLAPPRGGRAPGWGAGLALAGRSGS